MHASRESASITRSTLEVTSANIYRAVADQMIWPVPSVTEV
jgi:hypothetical protein